ncbi:hypothetical protein ACSYAD_31435 [Acaryochloris marina NIES-2412]|uniref:hypothetical protein n=1 Tax=Acaryochloris marina TaxID=155978 RepID=UPI00405A4452
MTKPKEYRFRINTGWRMNTDRAKVMSGVQDYYDRQFTSMCVNILHCTLKPLSVALEDKSESEVQLAVNEAKRKLDVYFEEALTMAAFQASSNGTAPQPSQVNVGSSDLQASEESVYSQQVDNLFDEEEDD